MAEFASSFWKRLCCFRCGPPKGSTISVITFEHIEFARRISKKQFIWFVSALLLLAFSVALAILLVTLEAYHRYKQKNPTLLPYPNALKAASRHASVLIDLPETQKFGQKYHCQGTTLSGRTILTSNACAKNLTTVSFSGKTFKINNVDGSDLSISQVQKFPLIKPSDLQLKLLEVAGDLTSAGMLILPLPPPTYHLSYERMGKLLFLSNGASRSVLVDFIHPFYCSLVYAKIQYVLQRDFLDCAILHHGRMVPNSSAEVCLGNAVGGSLVQNGYLIGVLTPSMVNTCGEIRKPFVFVNVMPHLEWFHTHKLI